MHSADDPPMTPSETTTLDDNQPLEVFSQEEAEGLLSASLHDGTDAIRGMIQDLWDSSRVDLEQYYRLASRVQEEIRAEESLPPLNLPEWDDVKPDAQR
jgi:hypothetical protein